jgi:hypothetical protein
MRTVLEDKYEFANEDFSHPKKIVAKGGDNSFGTKQNVQSSWSDFIAGVESPTLPHCRNKSAAHSQNFLRHEHLPSCISRSVEKCKEPSVARKEKTKIPIVVCTTRSGYVMGDEFHPLVNQQSSMPKCDPKKKAAVGDQNFLGSTKQHNKHCSPSFSEICSPHKEHKKKSAAVKGDENRGAHVAESSSPAKQPGNNCATAIDTRKELSTSLTIHAPNEPLPTDNIDSLNGLSLMSHEVTRNGTIAISMGQRCNIFKSECKIKEKVCKLIVDGGSFTNAISLDVVHALSLSTWRLPTPLYMQWMNTSVTLKITHKARVKFSVGTYVGMVDCTVAPLSACHLLLGRPWQFDLDATHGGCSNCYSFVHKGIHHVFKPMLESGIKSEVFALVKKKYQTATSKPKLRMAFMQGKENDVTISNTSDKPPMKEDPRIISQPRTVLLKRGEDIMMTISAPYQLQLLLL